MEHIKAIQKVGCDFPSNVKMALWEKRLLDNKSKFMEGSAAAIKEFVSYSMPFDCACDADFDALAPRLCQVDGSFSDKVGMFARRGLNDFVLVHMWEGEAKAKLVLAFAEAIIVQLGPDLPEDTDIDMEIFVAGLASSMKALRCLLVDARWADDYNIIEDLLSSKESGCVRIIRDAIQEAPFYSSLLKVCRHATKSITEFGPRVHRTQVELNSIGDGDYSKVQQLTLIAKHLFGLQGLLPDALLCEVLISLFKKAMGMLTEFLKSDQKADDSKSCKLLSDLIVEIRRVCKAEKEQLESLKLLQDSISTRLCKSDEDERLDQLQSALATFVEHCDNNSDLLEASKGTGPVQNLVGAMEMAKGLQANTKEVDKAIDALIDIVLRGETEIGFHATCHAIRKVCVYFESCIDAFLDRLGAPEMSQILSCWECKTTGDVAMLCVLLMVLIRDQCSIIEGLLAFQHHPDTGSLGVVASMKLLGIVQVTLTDFKKLGSTCEKCLESGSAAAILAQLIAHTAAARIQPTPELHARIGTMVDSIVGTADKQIAECRGLRVGDALRRAQEAHAVLEPLSKGTTTGDSWLLGVDTEVFQEIMTAAGKTLLKMEPKQLVHAIAGACQVHVEPAAVCVSARGFSVCVCGSALLYRVYVSLLLAHRRSRSCRSSLSSSVAPRLPRQRARALLGSMLASHRQGQWRFALCSPSGSTSCRGPPRRCH